MGAAAPDADALVFGGALAATILLYIIVPKGFFPVQDTGVILGISEAPPTARSMRWRIGSRR